MRRVALAAALLLWASGAAAQVYRWTDDKGKVHFTDTAPPPGASDVRKKDLAAGAPNRGDNLPFALRQPMKDFPVTLYSAPNCESCGPARTFLNARGVPFKEVSVRTDDQIAELNRAVGGNAVPALLVGSTAIRGFEEGAYQRALDIAGYPKSGEVPSRRQSEPHAPEAKSADEKPPAPAPARKSRYYSSPEG